MKKALVILSGGLDSTTCLLWATKNYDDVFAVSFDYNQKQRVELELAKKSCESFNVKHVIVQLGYLGQIASSVSANIIGSDIEMPTIEDVIGLPQPVTYVPNRNMIMLSIAAALAESKDCQTIVTGFQSNDTYGYWDTTQEFVNSLNSVFSLNRKNPVKIVAPFNGMSKVDEIKYTLENTGSVDLYKNTITCYNPDEFGHSCGECPSCAERLKAFSIVGVKDPIKYQV